MYGMQQPCPNDKRDEIMPVCVMRWGKIKNEHLQRVHSSCTHPVFLLSAVFQREVYMMALRNPFASCGQQNRENDCSLSVGA